MDEKLQYLIQKYAQKAQKKEIIDAFDVINDILNIVPDIEEIKIKKFAATLKTLGCNFINFEVFNETTHIESIDNGDDSNIRNNSSDDSYYEDIGYVGTNIDLFLKDVERYPLLKPREEYQLAKVMQNGDLAAREMLINSNIRLVINVTKRYLYQGLELDDLIQEGTTGLIKAAEKFDYRMGYKFSTYSTWWIKQSITRALADKGKLIRLPVHMVESLSKIKKMIYKFEMDNARLPTENEIAGILSISLQNTRIYLRYLYYYDNNFASLDMPIGEDDESTIGDIVASDNNEVETEVFRDLLKEDMERVLTTLKNREAKILKLRFGIEDGTSKTLEQIGHIFGVTRERIRQIEAKALRKLRHPSRSKQLKHYL